MRRDRVPRRLTVDDTVWLWTVGHRHDPDCLTFLTLRRTENRHSGLRLVFRDAPGRIVSGYPFGAGDIASTGGDILNLNEPGVVRRFLDEATARDLLPTAHGIRDEDGWPLYDTLTKADTT
ncbi:hypothetical protein OG259_27685 [Streptomyces sp. NBC_00250]|uniref:hypothetical protein n=1 Tax=Streptomyces sp. NBC_00250 TaxID=2903641 RepID=UPI002E27B975|nr:hypothetical protein [Streptomyces sp. NBC_00250]